MNHTSFFGQLGNSFLPMNYGEYENVDKADTTRFLRKFAIIVYMIIAAGYIFAVFNSSAGIYDGRIISEEDGYYYRIKDGELQIDEPILVDDLSNGVYVNITDEVEYFDIGGFNSILDEYAEKGYTDVLLISRTNRIKMTTKNGSYSAIINSFDDMKGTSEAGRNTVTPDVDAKFIAFLFIVGVVFCILYPFVIRIGAIILAVIAKLFCKLFRLDTDGDYLKTICVYAFIPAQILILIGYIAFTLIYGTDFLESGNGGPVYFAIETAAAVLPLIMVLAAAFADKKKYENY